MLRTIKHQLAELNEGKLANSTTSWMTILEIVFLSVLGVCLATCAILYFALRIGGY